MITFTQIQHWNEEEILLSDKDDYSYTIVNRKEFDTKFFKFTEWNERVQNCLDWNKWDKTVKIEHDAIVNEINYYFSVHTGAFDKYVRQTTF